MKRALGPYWGECAQLKAECMEIKTQAEEDRGLWAGHINGHAPKDLHHKMAMRMAEISKRVEDLEGTARETRRLTGGKGTR